MAFYHLEFKTKNIFTTSEKKLNLPVAKLAQHPVKNGERYGASCKLAPAKISKRYGASCKRAPAKKRYRPVANGR